MNRKALRILIYIASILILVFGLILNTKTGLGCSPILSIAFAVSSIFGYDLGDVTFVLYAVFVIIELYLSFRMKKDRTVMLTMLGQLPFSVVFTRIMNLFSAKIPMIADRPLPVRIAVLLIAIVFTGVGAAMVLDVKLIANPADGLVACLSEYFKREMGFVKNAFDISCITMACLICFVLSSPLAGVGIGSVIAMLLTGRVVALFNRIFRKKIDSLI